MTSFGTGWTGKHRASNPLLLHSARRVRSALVGRPTPLHGRKPILGPRAAKEGSRQDESLDQNQLERIQPGLQVRSRDEEFVGTVEALEGDQLVLRWQGQRTPLG